MKDLVGYLQTILIVLAFVIGVPILEKTGNNYTLGVLVVLIAVVIIIFLPAIIHSTIANIKKTRENAEPPT